MQFHNHHLGLHRPGVHYPHTPRIPNLQHVLPVTLLPVPLPSLAARPQFPHTLVHVKLAEGNIGQLDAVATAGDLVLGDLLQVGVQGVDTYPRT